MPRVRLGQLLMGSGVPSLLSPRGVWELGGGGVMRGRQWLEFAAIEVQDLPFWARIGRRACAGRPIDKLALSPKSEQMRVGHNASVKWKSHTAPNSVLQCCLPIFFAD